MQLPADTFSCVVGDPGAVSAAASLHPLQGAAASRGWLAPHCPDTTLPKIALCDNHYQLCLIAAILQLTAIFVPSPRAHLSCRVTTPDVQVQPTCAASCSQPVELPRQGSWWGRCLLGVVVAWVGNLPTPQHKHVINHVSVAMPEKQTSLVCVCMGLSITPQWFTMGASMLLQH